MKKRIYLPLFIIGFLFGFVFLFNSEATTIFAEEAPSTVTVSTNVADDPSQSDPTSNTDATNENTDQTTSTEPANSEEENWQYSKSKTATDLDENKESEVTLSLPSAEEKLTTEVAFVLDESNFSDTQDRAMGLLETLKQHADKTGAKVQVDVIGFKRAAYDHGSFDLTTQYDLLREAFKKKNSGGSNIHAGLLLAQQILAKNTAIPDDRKYMILVSDGDTYLYCKDGDYKTPYSRSYIPLDSAEGTAYGGFYDESWYYPSAPYGNNVKRPDTANPTLWDAYLQDVAARNQESNGDAYEYVWNYYDNWKNTKPTSKEFKTQPAVPRSASNMDMAFMYAANVYKDLANKYHCYSVAVQSLNQSDGGQKAFMDYLNGGKTADFDSIQNDILYYLGKGSIVEDYMGYDDGNYDFDLVDPSAIRVVIDNTGTLTTYNAERIKDNHYGFKKNEDGTYDYEVIYVPGNKKDDEHFIWLLNTSVTNFEHVMLKYGVKLIQGQTKPGTYTAYTNTKATLYPVNSEGVKGEAEDFERPMVTYTVKEAVKEPEKTSDQNTSKQTDIQTKNSSMKETTVCQASASTGYENHEMLWFITLGLSVLLAMMSIFQSHKTREFK